MRYETFKSVPNKKSWVNLAHLYLTFSLFIKYKSGTHNDLFASRPNQYNGVLLQSSPLEIWNPHFHKMPLSTMTHMSILRLIAFYNTSSSASNCNWFIQYEFWFLLERSLSYQGQGQQEFTIKIVLELELKQAGW